MKALSFVSAAVFLMLPLVAQADQADNPYIPAVPCPLHCRSLECPGVYYQSEIQLQSYIIERLELQEGLSPGARNLKICTTRFTVTIKGTVASLAEKIWVLKMARQVSGSGSFRVIDEVAVPLP